MASPSDKRIVIVFGISKDLTFALANTLLGLKKYCDNRILKNIIVYHDGISEEEKLAINKILLCKFTLYNKNDCGILANSAANIYSDLMYAKYECFNMLNDYDIVVWTDVDVLVTGDIKNVIFDAAKSGFGICRNNNFKNKDNFNKLLIEYNMDLFLYNSGFLIISRELPCWEQMADWCKDMTNKLNTHLKWPDQGILNLLLQNFNIVPYIIDIQMYQRHPYHELKSTFIEKNKSIKKPYLLHSYGSEKFWNSPLFFLGFHEWRENNKIWCRLRLEACDKKPPLVSVIMPVLNSKKYIEEAVSSILEQTFFDLELIIVDGGSSDETPDIIKNFNDPRILFLTDDSLGGNISTSLNLGIAHAKGKYIARMDADDIAVPHRIYTQYAFMEKHPEISICGTNAYIFQETYAKISIPTKHDDIACQLILGTPLVHPTVMWRKSDFENYGLYYDIAYSANEDLELWQRAVKHVCFGAITQSLLLYRDHESKVTKLSAYYKTRDAQLALMGRSFSEMGTYLSSEALLVADQRDNTCFMSDGTLSAAFAEFCSAARKVCSRQKAYPKSKLAIFFFSHCRWIFQTRLSPRYLGGAVYFRTALYFIFVFNLWSEILRRKFSFIREEKLNFYVSKFPSLGNIGHMLVWHPVLFIRQLIVLGKKIKNKLRNSGKQDEYALLLEKVWNSHQFSESKKDGGTYDEAILQFTQASLLAFNRYFNTRDGNTLKLQIGAGRNYIDGWHNTDIVPNADCGIYYLDCLKRFPLPDNSLDFVYSEHNIEHFSADEAFFIFREIERILKPGGVLRLVTPDLEKLWTFYRHTAPSKAFDEYTRYQSNTWMPTLAQAGIFEKGFVVNDFFRNWGYKVIYDFEMLKKVLEKANFQKIVKVTINESNYPDLQNIERHSQTFGDTGIDFNEIESMAIEAIKCSHHQQQRG
jgi:glycosyltransferase involved in cell wall biosynthesis/predicted SAM-dependent methyltransferase